MSTYIWNVTNFCTYQRNTPPTKPLGEAYVVAVILALSSALGQLIFLLTAQRRFPRCRPLELTQLICAYLSAQWHSLCLRTCRRVHLVWGSCIPHPVSLLWHHLQGKPWTLYRAFSYLAPDLNLGSALHHLPSRCTSLNATSVHNQTWEEISNPLSPESIYNLLNELKAVIWVSCLLKGTTRDPRGGSA